MDASENLTEPQAPIAKPDGFSLDKFKSKHAAAMANVETLQTALPHHSIAQAKDFVRLHPNEENHWSSELCFVDVPIKGQKRDTLHLIDEELAMRYLPSVELNTASPGARDQAVRHIFPLPGPDAEHRQHLEREQIGRVRRRRRYGRGTVVGRRKASTATRSTFARDPDAFPEPKWPTQSLDELIERTFAGRMIDSEDHPGLLRLIGAKQSVDMSGRTSTRSTSSTSSTRSTTAISPECAVHGRVRAE